MLEKIRKQKLVQPSNPYFTEIQRNYLTALVLGR